MFKLITTPKEFQQLIKELKPYKDLATDLEASVRKEWRSKGVSALNIQVSRIEIISISVRDQEEVYLIDYRILKDKYGLNNLIDLFRNKVLIGANIKYDLKLLYQECGVWFEARDIILMSRLIGNATGSKFAKAHGHGLGDLCRDWLNVHLEGKGNNLQGSDWGLPISERTLDNSFWRDKLAYAARDTAYIFPIYDQMLPVLINPLPRTDLIPNGTNDSESFGLGMEEKLDEENEIISIIASMEYTGIPASNRILTKLQKAIETRLEELAYELAIEFGLPTDTAMDFFSEELFATEKAKKTLNNPTELLNLIKENLEIHKIDNTQTSVLERTLEIIDKVYAERHSDDDQLKTKAESVEIVSEEEGELYQQMENLEESMIMKNSPLLRKIVEYRRLKKLEGMDLRKHINPATGYIHSSINQIGTATARISSSNPNVLQISARSQVEIEIEVESDGTFVR